jgi:hypothetical protein
MARRRLIIVTVVVLAAIAIGIIPSVVQFIAEREIMRLQSRGMRVQAQGVSGFILGITAQHIESWVPLRVSGAYGGAFPLQLRVEDVRISARYRPLALQTLAQAQGVLYGGRAQATITNLLSAPELEAHVSQLDLSVHPQLRALGIESGLVDASVTKHPLGPRLSAEASYSVSIKDLEIYPPSSLRSISGVSRIANGHAHLKASINQDGLLSVQSSTFDSSLASGAIQGAVQITPDGGLRNLRASIRVRLDRPDSNKLVPWLPTLPGQGVSGDATNFICIFRSAPCDASRMMRLGSECVHVSCSG